MNRFVAINNATRFNDLPCVELGTYSQNKNSPEAEDWNILSLTFYYKTNTFNFPFRIKMIHCYIRLKNIVYYIKYQYYHDIFVYEQYELIAHIRRGHQRTCTTNQYLYRSRRYKLTKPFFFFFFKYNSFKKIRKIVKRTPHPHDVLFPSYIQHRKLSFSGINYVLLALIFNLSNALDKIITLRFYYRY
ncbi:hypothetical protein AGLY_004890 [Aphis glycines]|uniref:Uncharacterized protein n=1 Tax=Aphis glycines TaxID=307491 RepID=A0A6G0TV67_APHGL|nr:hypothetical protein AGLY_004890 [Aphis glycines]